MSFPAVVNRPGPPFARQNHAEINLSACLDCGTPLPARLLEMARLDLIFLSDRPLRYGTNIQLAIFSDLVSAVTQNRAVVHWCRPHSSGWQIGAFLMHTLPDRLTESLWTDLRTTLRYDCHWKAWVTWAENRSAEAIRILNYSINGLRMQCSHPVEPNRPFSLFGSAGCRDRAVLNGHTQWCRPMEDGFQIGGLIHDQRGRDLPKMFGNLTAVHVEEHDIEQTHFRESAETLRYEQELGERFLVPRAVTASIHRVLEESATLLD
jgi:hypothetical protein